MFGGIDVKGRIILKWSLEVVSSGLRAGFIWQITESIKLSYKYD